MHRSVLLQTTQQVKLAWWAIWKVSYIILTNNLVTTSLALSGKPSGTLYSNFVIFWKQRYSFLWRKCRSTHIHTLRYACTCTHTAKWRVNVHAGWLTHTHTHTHVYCSCTCTMFVVRRETITSGHWVTTYITLVPFQHVQITISPETFYQHCFTTQPHIVCHQLVTLQYMYNTQQRISVKS